MQLLVLGMCNLNTSIIMLIILHKLASTQMYVANLCSTAACISVRLLEQVKQLFHLEQKQYWYDNLAECLSATETMSVTKMSPAGYLSATETVSVTKMSPAGCLSATESVAMTT